MRRLLSSDSFTLDDPDFVYARRRGFTDPEIKAIARLAMPGGLEYARAYILKDKEVSKRLVDFERALSKPGKQFGAVLQRFQKQQLFWGRLSWIFRNHMFAIDQIGDAQGYLGCLPASELAPRQLRKLWRFAPTSAGLGAGQEELLFEPCPMTREQFKRHGQRMKRIGAACWLFILLTDLNAKQIMRHASDCNFKGVTLEAVKQALKRAKRKRGHVHAASVPLFVSARQRGVVHDVRHEEAESLVRSGRLSQGPRAAA
jgi:hypothetical protein